ncbi:MAG TPA: hypothetical protein VLU25_21105 [Acidobacteriota bacterium]|nr:hypothetical protein [Acidobacteriota bacterium]
MAWITTYILLSIVGFYGLLSLFLLTRLIRGWLGPEPRPTYHEPPLPNWTPSGTGTSSETKVRFY